MPRVLSEMKFIVKNLTPKMLSDDTQQNDQNLEEELEIEFDKEEVPQKEFSQDQPSNEINLDKFKPLIPDIVLDQLLESNGVECSDTETKKAIAALAQKFISDVATSAYQYHKIHQKAALKDKRFAKEKKVTLNMEDLQKALEEYGIDISRPSYFI